MKNFMLRILLFFIPRFTTDRVALHRDIDGTLQVFCLEGQEREDDRLFIDCYGTVKVFTWLGFSSGGKCEID